MVDGIAVYDFSSIRFFWIGAAVLSCLLCAMLWKATAKKNGVKDVLAGENK